MIKNLLNTKAILKITKFFIYLSLFIPLIVSSRLYFPHITGKAIAFRFLIEIAFIFYLTLIINHKKYLPNFRNPLIITVSIFFIVLTITSFTGIDWHKSFFGSSERSEGLFHLLHYYVFFIIITSIFKKRKAFKIALSIFILVALFMSVYSWLGGNWSQDANNSMMGTLGHYTFFGTFLLFSIFFLLYFFFVKFINDFKNLIKKIKFWQILIFLFLILFLLTSLFKSHARGAILGLGIGLLLLIIFLILNGSFFLNKYIKLSILIIIISILTSGTLYYFGTNNYLDNVPVLNKFINTSLGETSIKNRILVWQIALNGIKEKPILGWGLENFPTAFTKHFNPEIYENPRSEVWFDRVHNIILDTGINSGIVGIISYISIFAAAFYLIFKKIKKDNKLLSFYFTSFLIAYFIQNLVLFDLFSSYIGFYLLLGLINFKAYNKVVKDLDNTQIKSSIYIKTTAILLIILNIYLIYFNCYLPYKSNRNIINLLEANNSDFENYFIKILEINSPFIISDSRTVFAYKIHSHLVKDIPTTNFRNTVNLAINEIKKDIIKHPNNGRNYTIQGKLNREAGRYFKDMNYFIESENVFKKGLEISPYHPEYIFGLSQTYIAQGKFDQAIELVNEFILIRPQSPYSYYFLGSIYELMDKNKLAEKKFKKVKILD